LRADKNAIFEYLKELKPLFSQKQISVVGFFGSFARDEQSVYSDIDIAIKKDENYLKTRSAYDYFGEIENLKNLLFKKFHRNVDVFDLDSNSTMKEAILKDLVYV